MPKKRMRPASRDEGFQALRRLRCFSEVHERLLAGWSVSELARFIQDDRSEYGHASRQGLMQVLQRYRDSIPPAQLMRRAMPKEFEDAKKQVDEGLDALNEMRKLYRLQMDRIAIGWNNEQNIKILLPTMTQEIRVAREVLTGIADLEMDLGLVTKAADEVNVNVNVSADLGKYGKKSIETVMNDPERRRKVLNVAERMLAFPGRLDKSTPSGDVIDATAVEVPAKPSTDDAAKAEAEELETIDALETEAIIEAEFEDHVVPDDDESDTLKNESDTLKDEDEAKP